jgi:hypothetical protein
MISTGSVLSLSTLDMKFAVKLQSVSEDFGLILGYTGMVALPWMSMQGKGLKFRCWNTWKYPHFHNNLSFQGWINRFDWTNSRVSQLSMRSL